MSYRPALVEFYRQHPTATQLEARRATGAPKSTVRHVYAQLVAAGRLRPHRGGRPAVLEAPCSP